MATASEFRVIAHASEIGDLKASIAQAKDGRGKTLFLRGEPGIGKTRIMRELGRLAEQDGLATLFGRCYGQAVPYSPWIDMLHEFSRQRSEDQLSKHVKGLPPELLSIIIEGKGPSQDTKPAGVRAWLRGPSERVLPAESGQGYSEGAIRLQIFEGFLRFFNNISTDIPLALFIDDLQLGDSASLQLLRYFAGKIVTRRIALIGAYRDQEIDESHLLSETILDLEKEGLCKVTSVEPLDLEETRDLIDSLTESHGLNQDVVRAVHKTSQGNPFFIRELTSSITTRLKASGQEPTRLLEEFELPLSIRALVKKKLVNLPADAIQALTIASVIGSEFSFDLLREVVQGDEDLLLHHLESCQKAGIILETPSSAEVRYRFSHPLVREVLSSELGTARRRRYHKMAADAIERTHGSTLDRVLDVLAFHYIEAGDQHKAVDFSLRAADRATRLLAYDEAAHHLNNAFDLCDIPGLRDRIQGDLLALRSKKDGWKHFIEDEADKTALEGWNRFGEAYERLVVPVFEPLARPVFELASPKPGQRVLDAGTGIGLLAFMMANAVGETGYVLGIDISEGMLSVARRKAQQRGLRNIEFKLMDDTSLALADDSLDMAVSSFGLPPFNGEKAISEIYRVLKNGGIFAFDEWEPGFQTKPGLIFENLLSKHRTTTPSEKLVMIREASSYRGRGFNKLYDRVVLSGWLEKVGFIDVETFKRTHEVRARSFEDYFDYQSAWWTIDAELREMSEDLRQQFATALKEAFKPLMDANGLLERAEVNYFKARKD